MNCVGRKIISITGAQPVGFVTDAQFQSAADDPVRLIFGVRVRAILRAGRVAPLKDAVTFIDAAVFSTLRASERLIRSSVQFRMSYRVSTISVSRWFTTRSG